MSWTEYIINLCNRNSVQEIFLLSLSLSDPFEYLAYVRSKNDRIYIKKKKKCVPPIFIRTTRNKLSQTTLKDAYRLEKRWTGYHYNDAGTRWRGDIYFFFTDFSWRYFFLSSFRMSHSRRDLAVQTHVIYIPAEIVSVRLPLFHVLSRV